ncbi:Inhibitor of the KinA pathway to sporulation, predicted exonuclease [Acetitomaculum ruminis DSM 5522]|uniref:Inhibitor of the KinA pathway to sporulation, predicted exonuclease n=1 Tax=Acetitomaculum ruminis DSM 5522 TaxID=1120918 RepID=A0A1I1A4H2_9FIRM|nr:3'-5' exonuclease [Acetitomaculum ruminis]SFB32851.1 Inhibitor of the KinA pathway to sporulation, predicted exonuclease [Acetitomaculum ruminis DSM 5522]
MNKVIIDLEFCGTSFKDDLKKKHSVFEIIEIGAVRLDENLDICDSFERLVKPEYGQITSFIEEFTGISNEKVKEAASFSTVMDEFLEWIAEDTTVLSWSDTDFRQIKHESELKKYSNPKLGEILDKWVDFQKIFCEKIGIEHMLSLSNAMSGMNIEFAGREHSALADAGNTAALYKLFNDEKEFEKRAGSIIDMFKNKEGLSFSLGSLLGDDILNKLPKGQ